LILTIYGCAVERYKKCHLVLGNRSSRADPQTCFCCLYFESHLDWASSSNRLSCSHSAENCELWASNQSTMIVFPSPDTFILKRSVFEKNLVKRIPERFLVLLSHHKWPNRPSLILIRGGSSLNIDNCPATMVKGNLMHCLESTLAANASLFGHSLLLFLDVDV
jgi:hypothetical protein